MEGQMVSNLEDLEKMFVSRIAAHEEKLQKVAEGLSSTSGNSEIATLSHEFNEFKTFIWKVLAKFKSQIELLSNGYDKHETVMRRKILLFHGLPENPQEKLHETIFKVISGKMNVSNISMDNLQVCHRLGSPQTKNRPVLVRFCDMEHRRSVWEMKTTLKGTGITISEFLTQTRYRVFIAARKHFGVNQSWTSEGKIVVLLPDKSRKKLEFMAELQTLIAQYPSSSEAASGSGKEEMATKGRTFRKDKKKDEQELSLDATKKKRR